MGTITGQLRKTRLTSCILLMLQLLAGCASDTAITAAQPGHHRPAVQEHPGLGIATTLIGSPYHFGGASPRGFDCSGLVYYAYGKAGIPVPRTTQAQHRHAMPVHVSQLHPGDLLFFRLGGIPIAHVGIYAGEGRFIHAPSPGKKVSYSSLNNAYWHTRLLAAGRY